jgi:hypothetical protein
MPRRSLAIVLIALVLSPSLPSAQTRGRASGSAAPPAGPSRTAPVLPAAVIAQLIELGSQGGAFRDITRTAGRTGTNLVVSSNRLEIVRQSAGAAAGAAYTPPPDVRRDEVKVTCLDTRQRLALDCDRLVVLVNEKAVPPLRSTGGPHTLTNDRGAIWQTRGIEAVYAAAALKAGFVVTALSGDGQSWTLVVTAEDAAERLLLGAVPVR